MAVFAEAFEDAPTYASAPPSTAYLSERLRDPAFIALVAIADGGVAGGLTAYELRKPEQERTELYIFDLAVAAQHRRRGIATRLIEALKAKARQRGCQVIFVQADHDDPPAIALYERLGRRSAVLHFDIDVE